MLKLQLLNYPHACTYYCVLLIACMYTDNEKPTIELFNKLIRNRVATQWRDLGKQLLEDEWVTTLNVIESNHPNDDEKCCTEMFNYWLTVDSDANWNKLMVALEQINQNTLAARIKEKLLLKVLLFCRSKTHN